MNTQRLSPYNQAVKQAYFKLLKQTKQLLATIERHELRYTLQREDSGPLAPFIIVHEIVSPLLYLTLKAEDGEQLTIHFGFEMFENDNEYSNITARFVRLLYKLTSAEYTTINIESCITTRYVITNCSELYECLEDARHKLHQFTLIKHRPSCKRILAVA